MISLQNIGYSHDSTILVTCLCADIEDCHRELMVEVSKAKLSPKIFLS